MNGLPPPDQQRQVHSDALLARLREYAGEGDLSFAQYMHHVLYEPGLGYYANGLQKFGADGDFVTAAEISPLFARCIARQARQVLRDLGGGEVLEFGAGSGVFAAGMLLELERLKQLPTRYCILEVSALLRDVQHRTIRTQAAHLLQRVEWLDTWPTAWQGFAVGNEVLDAMPVERFRWRSGAVEQMRVAVDNNGPRAVFAPAATALASRVEEIRHGCRLAWPEGYLAEVNCLLPPWFASFARIGDAMALLLLDYGYSRHEYYHPGKTTGTLRCHYQQRAHDDPWYYPGLQDITAHVDFSAVAEAGTAAGLVLEGFTNQRQFLLNCGLAELVETALAAASATDRLAISQQVQRLTLPIYQGETCNAIGFSRNLPHAMAGFLHNDQAHRL